jgi:hypothetical protein
MALFRRAKSSQQASSPPEEENKRERGSWKRPASPSLLISLRPPTSWPFSIDTAFKQQRLKAWQPILTPKTVLPTLLIIGIIFAPIGALLIIGSNKARFNPWWSFFCLIYFLFTQVTEITIDYTNCDQLTPVSSLAAVQSGLATVPHYNYRLRSSESGAHFSAPQYAFINSSSPQCVVQFDVPFNITPSVLFYYKLTNFFQNHRRYVQSYDPKQLNGQLRTVNDLKNGNCKPLATVGDQVVYPCGLIANSLFNGMTVIVVSLTLILTPIARHVR